MNSNPPASASQVVKSFMHFQKKITDFSFVGNHPEHWKVFNTFLSLLQNTTTMLVKLISQ